MLCVCVCERERERQRETETETETEIKTERSNQSSSHFTHEGQWKDGQHWAKTQMGVISVRAPN
jgi:hypothetical protein